jgi:CPA2 family monovalent cation:H+ antiporter-2
MMFGVSFALGAFFAGMILSESELSHQAAEETLPLRDAFAVLFFVAAGMLFDPAVILEQPIGLIATLLIIIFGKSIAAFLIMRAFGHAAPTALTVSASLAQIGEFSFILATLGMDLGILPEEGRDLIIAGAIISIILNPLVFHFAMHYGEKRAAPVKAPETDVAPTKLTGHAIVIGFGRVGMTLVEGLKADGLPVLVVDDRLERVDRARAQELEAIYGNAADPDVFGATNAAGASLLLVAIPSVFEAGQILAKARAANAGLKIVARAHSDEEVAHLRSHGATEVILGEHELAVAMLARARMLASAPPIPVTGPEPPTA